MSSREEFLRSMGMSESDMANPDDQPQSAAPTRANNASSRLSSSLLIHRNLESNSSGSFSQSGKPTTKGTNATAAQKPSARSRDDSESGSGFAPQPPQRKPVDAKLSATGSQEVFAAEVRANNRDTISRPMETTPSRADVLREAEQLKQEGNDAFQRQEFRKAIRCYSKAIEADPTNAALYSNRSAAYLAGGAQTGMDTRSLALRDALKAAELNPTWPKAYCRQAEAFIELDRFAEAKTAYERAAELDPTTDVYRIRAKECGEKVGPQRSGSTLNPDMRTRPASGDESRASARELQARYLNEEGGDVLRGNEFKEAELERLRQRRSSDSFSADHSTSSASGSATTSGRFGPGSSGYVSAARNVPKEYSSDAAKAYQQALLDEYRKRKAQGKA